MEKENEVVISQDERKERTSMLVFNKLDFARLVTKELSTSKEGRAMLKKYKQSEIREIIENYKLERNQVKLREISQLLIAKSPQYRRLVKHFADLVMFSYIIAPIKNIRKLNKNKVLKQYEEVGELLKTMSLKHEMKKLLRVAYTEDVFFGYIHKDKNSFHIQKVDASIAKITSIEDGVYNWSIDMSYFQKQEDKLVYWAKEIQVKYREWKVLKSKNPKISDYVELDPRNTICIKVNEELDETFPPFAGSFDAIFDIEGFKQLRKDKEELGNYAIVTQKLPIRADSEHNNDFVIDEDMMRYFHMLASDTVPENVGVITSPMALETLKFDKDRVDSDGVGKATRDFWEGSGTSQALFSSDNSTSAGLAMSIKSDEELAFDVATQINRWINRYLRYQFNDLMFNVEILRVTSFNQKEQFDMLLTAGQNGIPVKNRISAIVGLEPIETMNMAFLENDLLKMHEEFVPLQTSHTQSGDGTAQEKGQPKKEPTELSDEGNKSRDKDNK